MGDVARGGEGEAVRPTSEMSGILDVILSRHFFKNSQNRVTHHFFDLASMMR